MKRFDLNADLGEMDTPEGHASDAAILSVVSSASIACGGHAGNAATMDRAVRVAKAEGVRIGAHPAYPDREGFGRRSRFPIAKSDLLDTLVQQITALQTVARAARAEVAYVKPHGALYNDAVADPGLAETIVAAVVRAGVSTLMGAPNSELERAAGTRLRFQSEGFLDRRYDDRGHLVPRSEDGAVLATDAERLAQLERLVLHGEVETASGGTLTIACETLCVHGDSPGAMATARAARARLEQLGFTVAAS